MSRQKAKQRQRMEMRNSLVLVCRYFQEKTGTAMNKLYLPLTIKQNDKVKTSACTNRVSMVLDRSHYDKIKYSDKFSQLIQMCSAHLESCQADRWVTFRDNEFAHC